jgi:hypothetical protein
MIYKAIQFFGTAYLATFGVHAVARNHLSDMGLSKQCEQYMLTEPQRLVAVICQSVNADTMQKFAASTVETQRRLDETASLVQDDAEQAVRFKLEKSVKRFNRLSRIFTQHCPAWQENVPADCQTEISAVLANADQDQRSRYEL